MSAGDRLPQFAQGVNDQTDLDALRALDQHDVARIDQAAGARHQFRRRFRTHSPRWRARQGGVQRAHPRADAMDDGDRGQSRDGGRWPRAGRARSGPSSSMSPRMAMRRPAPTRPTPSVGWMAASTSRLAASEAGLALKASSIRSKHGSSTGSSTMRSRVPRPAGGCPVAKVMGGDGRIERPAPRPRPARPARSARSGGPGCGTLNRSGVALRGGLDDGGVGRSGATSISRQSARRGRAEGQ